MTDQLESIFTWLCCMTPDKLAIVLPFFVGYAIIRIHAVNTNWCWLVCPALAAVLFGILGTNDATKTALQNWTFRCSTGLVLGFIAAIVALGVHSLLFKKLSEKFPVLQFLVLSETPEKQPRDNNPEAWGEGFIAASKANPTGKDSLQVQPEPSQPPKAPNI